MANNKSNVSVGKPKIGGAIWRAPSGTALPTNATTALGSSFVCLGYISEDGVVNGANVNTSEIKAWGGDTVLVANNGRNDTYQFTMIETLNAEANKVVYGDDNVSGNIATGLAISANAKDLGEHVYVIEQELNGSVKKRTCIPAGRVSNIGDITYKDDTAIGYQVTITALPDASENTHYDYMVQAST